MKMRELVESTQLVELVGLTQLRELMNLRNLRDLGIVVNMVSQVNEPIHYCHVLMMPIATMIYFI